MDSTFDPKNFVKYKFLLNDLQSIENLIENYVTDVIEDSYSSIVLILTGYVDDIKSQNEKWLESVPQFAKYQKKQVKLIDYCINIIDSHRYENISLFAAFSEIKKKLIDRKLLYKNIIGSENSNINCYDVALQNLKNSLKYYELKFLNSKEIYFEKAYTILESKESSGLIKILYSIKQDIINTNKENFYNIYSKSMVECKNKGNKSFSDLYSFMLEEIKLFKYIKDTLAGLELSFLAFSEADSSGLLTISDTIIGMYNNCVNELHVTKPIDTSTTPPIEVMTLSRFSKVISQNNLTYVSETVSFDTFATFATNVSSQLEKVKYDFTNLFFQYNYKYIYDETNKQITFGNQLYEMFSSINIYIDNIKKNGEIENTTFKNIIDGISETITIKRENIKEKISEFDNVIKNQIIYINDESYRKISKLIFDKCFKNSELNKLENIYDIIITEKLNLNESEKIYEKEILKIKKDCILYEISTFEEIVNHSVLALRKSKNIEIVDFVEFMDMINLKIDKVLLDNNIIKILPVEHEIFSGKEHTVLVAEKNGSFSKGEIIKVIGTGYKDQNQVFIKANVVAAK